MSEKEQTQKQQEEQPNRVTEMVESEKYLNSGAHIGTKFKSGDMKKYIYKMRKDGLFVLDISTIDSRIKAASKMLSETPSERIAVVARRTYAQTAVKEFAQCVGAKAFTGRFIPGTFTNPKAATFFEPKIVVVVDPETDVQAIEEATRIRVPVISLVSTNNSLRNIDLAVPINNKGKKSLALVFWIFAREVLKAKGEISGFSKKIEDFEYKVKEDEEGKQTQEKSQSVKNTKKNKQGKDKGNKQRRKNKNQE
ncbi:MAG: 30S ribosomal protein S2 [Candidatus Diapherotrites archaeon]